MADMVPRTKPILEKEQGTSGLIIFAVTETKAIYVCVITKDGAFIVMDMTEMLGCIAIEVRSWLQYYNILEGTVP